MIRYSLECETGHAFEAWFKSADDFDGQQARGFLSCPECGSARVGKAIMAPAIARSERRETMTVANPMAAMAEQVKAMVREIRAQSVDVGEAFPEEARKIHYGEAEQRGIIGKASGDEVRALVEEGIGILPLPTLPEDAN